MTLLRQASAAWLGGGPPRAEALTVRWWLSSLDAALTVNGPGVLLRPSAQGRGRPGHGAPPPLGWRASRPAASSEPAAVLRRAPARRRDPRRTRPGGAPRAPPWQ